MRRIVYDGDSFYELDEECVKRHRQEQGRTTDQNVRNPRVRPNVQEQGRMTDQNVRNPRVSPNVPHRKQTEKIKNR